eukprot:scaffold293541_cov33-Tisochrysis_lutea.AAC.1
MQAVEQALKKTRWWRERRDHCERALVQTVGTRLLPVEEHKDPVCEAQRHLGSRKPCLPVTDRSVSRDVRERADVAMGADVPLKVGQEDDLPPPVWLPHRPLYHEAVAWLKQQQPRLAPQLDVGVVEEDGAYGSAWHAAQDRLERARLVDLS